MDAVAQEWFNSSGPYSRTRNLTLWDSGELTYAHRATPADVWSAPETVSESATLADARSIAERLALTAATYVYAVAVDVSDLRPGDKVRFTHPGGDIVHVVSEVIPATGDAGPIPGWSRVRWSAGHWNEMRGTVTVVR